MLLAIVETQKRCHLPPGDVVVASNSASLQAGSKSVEPSPALRWKGHWRPMVFPFFFGNVKHHVTLVSSGHFRATYKWKRKKIRWGILSPSVDPSKKIKRRYHLFGRITLSVCFSAPLIHQIDTALNWAHQQAEKWIKLSNCPAWTRTRCCEQKN